MKELKLSKKYWHCILWVSTWGKYLPQNICQYFWSLIGAILISPLAIIGHILNICKSEIVAAWWVIYPPICMGLGLIMNAGDPAKHIPFNIKHHSCLYIFGQGVMVSVIVAIVLGLILFIGWLRECWDNRPNKPHKTTVTGVKYSIEKKPNPLIEGFKAWKGKYCTPIKWQ